MRTFRLPFCALVLLAAMTGATARAQDPSSGSRPPPDPRRGFQVGIRPNVAIPMGEAFGGADLSLLTTPLVGVDADIGWKPTDNLFLGGRPSVAVGGIGDADDLICGESESSCYATRVGAGIEAQYHVAPGARFNPWLGYGLGLDVLQITRDVEFLTVTSSLIGFDFARLSGGLDWRLSRGFGLGLFVDFSLGMYLSESVTARGPFADDYERDNSSNGIDDTTMHYWLSMGPRFVIFP